MTVQLSVGFIPLVDMAPLAIAREIGFAEEEGLDLVLHSAPSWSTLRDLLALGQIEAAHMLAPVPIASALGAGGVATRMDALSVLSVNGNVIGVSRDLAKRMRDNGYSFDFADPNAAGQALTETSEGVLRVGVPFPYSMHSELLSLWLSSFGFDESQGFQVKTIPPPLMARAIADGEIDAFCVGEPWGSIAVEDGVGELLLPTSAIWSFAPEKVLAVRHEWTIKEPALTRRLMRAVWRAGRWLGQQGNLSTASEILSRPEYVNVAPELIERSLVGQLVISPQGETRKSPGFLNFFDGAATFPWKSQAAFIGERLALRTGLDKGLAIERAAQVFRTDLYRANLSDVGAEMPGASEKLEGGNPDKTGVASVSGRLILEPNSFFDGTIFDPADRA